MVAVWQFADENAILELVHADDALQRAKLVYFLVVRIVLKLWNQSIIVGEEPGMPDLQHLFLPVVVGSLESQNLPSLLDLHVMPSCKRIFLL